MCNIKVSIIIPIYNAEKHLEECLESCIHQTLEEIEIICVNDGSTDDTEIMLNRYAFKHDKIIILKQQNQGAGSARNLGMKYVRGEFIAFMDSDDYYPNNEVLKKLYNAAVRENASICGGAICFSQYKDSKSTIPSDKKMHYKDYQHSYGFTRYLYNTCFLKNNNIQFPLWRRYEDPPFMVDAMVKAQVFYVISDVVYIARNTDKVIHFKDKNLLMGILKGIKHIVNVSKENQFEVLHTDMVIRLMQYTGYVYQSVYNGDLEIKKKYDDILNCVDKALLEKDSRQIKIPKKLSDEEITQVICNSLMREKKLIQKINLYKTLLIYGAGRAGRSLYDYLKRRNYNGTVEFVVSAENPEYTACGKAVRCINDYVDYRNDVLVIIANKDHIKEMEENAKRHKFRNIEKISYDELKLFGADITFDNYITIY